MRNSSIRKQDLDPKTKEARPSSPRYLCRLGRRTCCRADDGPEILLNTLNRELTEELFIKEAFQLNRNPIGLIRTSEDARASRHIGVLYEITLKSEDVAVA